MVSRRAIQSEDAACRQLVGGVFWHFGSAPKAQHRLVTNAKSFIGDPSLDSSQGQMWC